MSSCQVFEQAVGHGRLAGRLHFLDLLDQDPFTGGESLQYKGLLIPGNQQAIEHPSVLRPQDGHAIVLADHGAGVEDVLQKIIETGALGTGQVWSDRLPFPEEPMALGTSALEKTTTIGKVNRGGGRAGDGTVGADGEGEAVKWAGCGKIVGGNEVLL